ARRAAVDAGGGAGNRAAAGPRLAHGERQRGREGGRRGGVSGRVHRGPTGGGGGAGGAAPPPGGGAPPRRPPQRDARGPTRRGAPDVNEVEQVVPQLMPAGALVTVRLPAPALLTVSAKDDCMKLAVTF